MGSTCVLTIKVSRTCGGFDAIFRSVSLDVVMSKIKSLGCVYACRLFGKQPRELRAEVAREELQLLGVMKR